MHTFDSRRQSPIAAMMNPIVVSSIKIPEKAPFVDESKQLTATKNPL